MFFLTQYLQGVNENVPLAMTCGYNSDTLSGSRLGPVVAQFTNINCHMQAGFDE